MGRYGLSNKCTDQCAGDPTQNCGGRHINSVYKVWANLTKTEGILNTSSPLYIGCYNEYYYTGHNDLPYRVSTAKLMNIDYCVESCLSLAYEIAGLYQGYK